MHGLDNEIYHIWRPELDEVVNYAIKQRSVVEIRTHWPLDECNFADAQLFGRFLAINNFQAQFLVENYDLNLNKNFPLSPECEYNFSTDININADGKARIEYGGRASILDTELNKNNIPDGLLLRISLPSCIRRLRLHDRFPADSIVLMPGLMLIDSLPASRRRLLTLLGHYYKDKKRPRPQIINISAGGVCLQTEDTRCHRFMGTDENYLFFFFSGNFETLTCPNVFVCKKVGLFRGNKSKHAGLRIRFVRELVWDQPENELKWIDIGDKGSESLNKILKISDFPRK